MTTRIAYTDADGYTIVILPAYGDLARDPVQTDEELIQFLIDGLEPGTEYILIDDEDPDVKSVLLQRDKRDDWIITEDGLGIKA